jgi:hypothetical protein
MMETRAGTICKLCHKSKVLVNSHIIPEFAYKNMYLAGKNLRQTYFLSQTSPNKPIIRQNGPKTPLLCEECDNKLLNQKYEKPFQIYWDNNFPNISCKDYIGITLKNYDYRVFKLFHLSIIYRAAVCGLPGFKHVKLGKHEEILRKMILDNNAGEYWEYPVFCIAVIDDIIKRNYRIINDIIKLPVKMKYNGHYWWETFYLGCYWYVVVSSQRNTDIDRICIKPNSDFSFPIQKASKKLLSIDNIKSMPTMNEMANNIRTAMFQSQTPIVRV